MPTGGYLNRLPFIVKGLSQGMSGRSILTGLREADMGMGTTPFYRLVGAARNLLAQRPATTDLPSAALVGLDVATPRPSALYGEYIYHSALAVRNLITGAYEERWVTTVSATAMARGAIEQAAADAWTSQSASNTGYTLAGGGVTLVDAWYGTGPAVE